MFGFIRWGGLEWYYFLDHWYGNLRGIVEFIAEWVSHTDPQAVKAMGILAAIIIVLLVGWRSGEIFRKRP